MSVCSFLKIYREVISILNSPLTTLCSHGIFSFEINWWNLTKAFFLPRKILLTHLVYIFRLLWMVEKVVQGIYHVLIEEENGRFFIMKIYEEWYMCVSYATTLNAACSILLNAEIIFFLSFELKQTSVENFIFRFRVVSNLWRKML